MRMQVVPFEVLVNAPDEFEVAVNPLAHSNPNGLVNHHTEGFKERTNQLALFMLESNGFDDSSQRASRGVIAAPKKG